MCLEQNVDAWPSGCKIIFPLCRCMELYVWANQRESPNTDPMNMRYGLNLFNEGFLGVSAQLNVIWLCVLVGFFAQSMDMMLYVVE